MYIRTKRTSALKARRPSGVTLIHSETHKVIQGKFSSVYLVPFFFQVLSTIELDRLSVPVVLSRSTPVFSDAYFASPSSSSFSFMATSKRRIKPTAKAQENSRPSSSYDELKSLSTDNTPMSGRKRKGKAGRKARVPASAPDHDSDHDDSRSCAQSPASALAPAVQDAAIAEHPETAPELDDASEPTPPRQKKRKIVPPKRKVKPSAKARAAKDDGNGDELGNNIESSDDSEEDREEYVQYLTTNPKSPFATMDLIVSVQLFGHIRDCSSPFSRLTVSRPSSPSLLSGTI